MPPGARGTGAGGASSSKGPVAPTSGGGGGGRMYVPGIDRDGRGECTPI